MLTATAYIKFRIQFIRLLKQKNKSQIFQKQHCQSEKDNKFCDNLLFSFVCIDEASGIQFQNVTITTTYKKIVRLV